MDDDGSRDGPDIAGAATKRSAATAILLGRQSGRPDTDQQQRAPVGRRARFAWLVALAALAAVAFVLRLDMLLGSAGSLVGPDGYDDGVYYSAADALVHGRLPYREFLFLHPPGILLALAPFAWLGSLTADPVGMALARLAFLALGAANTVLVAVLARRYGLAAGLSAGVLYAVLRPAVFAERSTLLEPLGTVALLVALLLARRAASEPRIGLLLAGAAAGAAACVKIWWVVPLAVLVAVQRTGRLRVLTGAGIAAAVLLLPFLIAAPVPMVREVVLDQVGRPRFPSPTVLGRLASIVGAPAHGAVGPLPAGVVAVLVVLVVLGLGVLACTVPGAAMYPLLTAACVLVLLLSPPFYPHYPAFATPVLAITVGIGAGRLRTLLPSRPVLGRAAVGVVVVALMLLGGRLPARTSAHAFPAAVLLSAAARVHGCVTTDDPTLLPAMDVLSRDLAAGCAVWPDVNGITDDRDQLLRHGAVVPRTRNPRWQHDVLAYLRSGAAEIVDRPTTGLDAASRAALDRGAVILRDGRYVLRSVRR